MFRNPGSLYPAAPNNRRRWPVRLFLVLWTLQLGWLVWLLHPEAGDLIRRLRQGAVCQHVRQEDAFYCWLQALDRVLPPQAAYVFLDRYEVGKEIEARYHLFPRRHLLLSPQSPPSLLFHILKESRASHILVRDASRPTGPGLAAALKTGAATPMALPGPGLVFQVDQSRLAGGFYD